MDIKEAHSLVINALKQAADPEVKGKYEWYFKRVIKFRGLKSPSFKEVFKAIYPEISGIGFEQLKQLAYMLFESEYSEDKSFGNAILLKNIKHLNESFIPELARIIDKHVYDWGTCDGLAGKLLGRMIKQDSKIAKLLVPWKDAQSLWRQRAACVAFVNIARHGQFNDLILKICSDCVKNPERFTQLGVGWVLRELSLAELDLVMLFITKNYELFSREGLRYAIEKMEPGLRQEMLNFKK